ncbi:uncharacterized protein LOC142164013 [Nicotiana tabacum]|uniref:Uncharacterized protein LOC142164013 n=1 Tax=Nicotiana tabacum TaxID=4097 RepID=A0AC58RX30_TOBAC
MILEKRKVNIACIQETRWVGSRAKDADEYKLWYFGVLKGKNGVSILVYRDLRESVVEVRRVNDRLTTIKLVVGECILNVVNAYAPQTGLDGEVKRSFWEGLDEIVRNIPPAESLFIGGERGEFNEHIGSSTGSCSESFSKREEHLVTFQSTVLKTQIDYILLMRCDRGLSKDFKVIPDETLAAQHRFLVKDVDIMIRRKKRYVRGHPRIRWGALTKDKAQDLEGRLSAMGSWRSSGDASSMWLTTTDCIRKAARKDEEDVGRVEVEYGGSVVQELR